MTLNNFQHKFFSRMSMGISTLVLGISVLTLPQDGFAMHGEGIAAGPNTPARPRYVTGVLLPDSTKTSSPPICEAAVSLPTQLITPAGDVISGVLTISSEAADEDDSLGGMRPFGWRDNHPDYFMLCPPPRFAEAPGLAEEITPAGDMASRLLRIFSEARDEDGYVEKDFKEFSTLSADDSSTMRRDEISRAPHSSLNSTASHYTLWPVDEPATTLRDGR